MECNTQTVFSSKEKDDFLVEYLLQFWKLIIANTDFLFFLSLSGTMLEQ